LDGDGAIFNPQLISQGLSGGHSAAQRLSDAITHHLTLTVGTNHYQLWVYIFLNKRGLMDTFGRVGLLSAKTKFEEFILGFNQAAERFLLVDVGGAKEAADAKIKGKRHLVLVIHHSIYSFCSSQPCWKMRSNFRKPRR
jgi:hypothetical protein